MERFERFIDAVIRHEVAKAAAMCDGAACQGEGLAMAVSRGLARVVAQCASAHGHFITAESFDGRGVPCMIFGWSSRGSNLDISVWPSTQLFTE